MDPKHAALRTFLLATLAGCADPEVWPECGNEAELTAEDYDGSLDDGDFYVCGPLPEDGSACAEVTELNATAFFEENVGPASDDGSGYLLRADCGPEPTRPDACCYVIENEGTFSAGRPFVVEGAARVAGVRLGAPGARAGSVDVAALPAAERAALARHWTAAALAEHASVASFARFGLDLLALGAPPDLLLAAARAQADEVVHARLAFGLASAYAGRTVAPGPLAMHGAVLGADPVEVARSLAHEGCVGETVAVAIATAALDGARDPAVRRVLTRIVRDEARHAALAWRAARWIRGAYPETGAAFDAAVRESVEQLVEHLGASAGAAPEGLGSALLRAHGVLDAVTERAEAAAAARGIVGVVAEGLAA